MSYTLRESQTIDASLRRAKRIARELYPNALCITVDISNGQRRYIIFDDSLDLQMSKLASGNTELGAWNVLVRKVEQVTLKKLES